jgi:hypothetical protein
MVSVKKIEFEFLVNYYQITVIPKTDRKQREKINMTIAMLELFK